MRMRISCESRFVAGLGTSSRHFWGGRILTVIACSRVSYKEAFHTRSRDVQAQLAI